MFNRKYTLHLYRILSRKQQAVKSIDVTADNAHPTYTHSTHGVYTTATLLLQQLSIVSDYAISTGHQAEHTKPFT